MILNGERWVSMGNYLFSSESVGIGHPDKICDQIADAIVDACIEQDPTARVACDAIVTSSLVILMGEITTKAQVSYNDIIQRTIQGIGYDRFELGFDYRTCSILVTLKKQSPDIAIGVNEEDNVYHQLGAGDQGSMFGYACDETAEFMPLPITFANQIVRKLRDLQVQKQLSYLRPDAKAQVTVEYDQNHQPLRIHTIVLSTQHAEEVSQEQIHQDMKKMMSKLAPEGFLDEKTIYYINPTGRFVIGGPQGDCGLTGKKIIVDTYGGMAHHGGGSFSGKDPTKVDRSGAYAARYVAKNIVAAKLAKRCEVQFSYAIGIPYPVSLYVNTFGTGKVDENRLKQAILQVFDLSPKGIITMLRLQRPIFLKTAFGGHFGRIEPEFTWEALDKVQDLLKAFTSV